MKASLFCGLRKAAVVWIVGLIGIAPMGTARVDAATLYVSPAGNDGNDGLSWSTAKRTVQAGLNAAAPGDQVWVAAGTYVECVTLKAGVALSGGFAGDEDPATFDLAGRDLQAHQTILDGNKAGSVVTAPSGADQTTRIDGFTIRNGSDKFIGSVTRGGGGIYCLSHACPTIANNTIVANTPTLAGGGIFCDSNASPTITGNMITGNTANNSGGGIYCYYNCSPIIANNRIAGNASCGIYCRLSSPTIVNNTIVGNTGTPAAGIYIDPSSSPTIVNTIVAFNSAGINQDSGTGTPVLRYNCVYGNTAYNYSGVTDPTGTAGNISADPGLADVRYGNVHIQPDSPCLDAGDDSVVQPGWTDMDGRARIHGAHVDIGADESDGTTWPPGPNVIVRVSPTGDDANDGSSWALAKRTVQEGIDTAAAAGGEVWVAAGVYVGRITLRSYAHLYGGFAGAETQRSARNWSANATILDGAQAGSVVTADRIGRDLSTIDGFTIRNGTGTRKATGYPVTYLYYGGGIYCKSASPTIANNTITANSAATSGGGIYASNASPTLAGNIVTSNSAGQGAGIYCAGSPVIADNRICGNAATSNGGGIYCCNPVLVRPPGAVTIPMITSNLITGNRSVAAGAGIYCYDGMIIANNTITANDAASGGGIYCPAGSIPFIGTSTPEGDAATSAGDFIGYGPSIANTIIAFNSSGLYSSSMDVSSLRYNCVYGNASYNYSGLGDPTGTNGNISTDPQFVRPASPGSDGVWSTADDDYGDLRLLPGSPCIDAGSNADVAADVLDLDGDGDTAEPLPFDMAGQRRLLDDPATTDTGAGTAPIVDIGAYEYFCGDANGDGHLDASDLLMLAQTWAASTGQPGFDPRCDLTHDGRIDVSDLLVLAHTWHKPGDINADGFVDVADLLILAGVWGLRAGDPGWDSRCDLNGDSSLDVSDLLILAAGWGQ